MLNVKGGALGGAVVPDAGDAVERAFGGAAIAFGKFARGDAHAVARGVVFDELNPDFAQTWPGRDLHSGVRVEKLVGHLFEIFH